MKKIIVIGSGWSGSGAVFDYLAGRPDVMDPFLGNEFRIVGDPGGLFDLQTKISKSFSVQGADDAIKDFIKVCQLKNKISKIRFKKPPLDMNIIDSFINDITLIKYRGLAAYEFIEKPLFYQVFAMLMMRYSEKKGKKANIGNMYYPVNLNDFFKSSEKMITRFISNEITPDDTKSCVINHGGTFWNPLESTICYGDDRHIIVVTRDPRDIFVEVKAKGNAYPTTNALVFSQWYKDMMHRISHEEWMNKKVTVIKFEEFVTNFETQKKLIDTNAGIDPTVLSTYNPNDSVKNIGKYKCYLSKEEIEIIEEQLKEYLFETGN